MRVITLILIALFITGVSFAEDRLDKVPSMSGEIEIMEQLGLSNHKDPTKQVLIPKDTRSQRVSPDTVRIHHLADIMTLGD
jgi:hypothetical protein